MHYTGVYQSPLGELLLAAGGDGGVTGIWFQGAKYFARGLDPENEPREVPAIQELRRWLDLYFTGRDPGFEPPVHLSGTPFQLEVWALLRRIPYGATTTYGAIAGQIAGARGLARISAQAVGGAVGHNKLSILIPCHRVLGADGSLTGYAGGLRKKQALLALERGTPLS